MCADLRNDGLIVGESGGEVNCKSPPTRVAFAPLPYKYFANSDDQDVRPRRILLKRSVDKD